VKTMPLSTLTAIALMGFGVTACGAASKGSSSSPDATVRGSSSPAKTSSNSSDPAEVQTQADSDSDNDLGAPYDDSNNDSTLDYGHAASTSETQAVTKLVRRYYAAAVAGGGAEACSMIYSSLAEAAVEDYGHGSEGPHYLSSATTCPAVMELLFAHFHKQLAVELPLLKVARVRLVRNRGLAILSFGAMPERELSIAREGHDWKVQALLDSELP